MLEKEFNLLHEPWIMVMRKDGGTQEISMLELFRKASEYRSLAGELPTQDIAILRLLLAVLHAVFGRYDINGTFAPPKSPQAVLERWKALWDKGSFPMEIIEKYLLHFEERFYLFHPEHPFYQVSKKEKFEKDPTGYKASKLNGEMAESNNKDSYRLFLQRSGHQKEFLQISEAARWLIHVNAFDDSASKTGTGIGWLGKLGLITAVGENLFETLVLNLVLLKDGGNELWGGESPVWENEKVKREKQVVIPNNPSELLSFQSRWIRLESEGNEVVGFEVLGGSAFSEENSFQEQMTLWRNVTKKTGPPKYIPRQHDRTRQLWRDFSVLIGHEDARTPGIVGWLVRLKEEQLIPRSHFNFMTAAIEYGEKKSAIEDVFSDSITFSGELLTALGESWVNKIINEIKTTDRLVEQVVHLAKNLGKASGLDESSKDGKSKIVELQRLAKGQAFYLINQPFRKWLKNINPLKDNSKKEEICNQWWEQARITIQDFGKEMVSQSGPQAFIGRIEENKKTKKKYRHTAPEAYDRFLYHTSSREALNKPYKKED